MLCFIPHVEEMQQRHSDHRGPGLRQDHLKEDTQRTGAIDHGGFIQIPRDAFEILAQQEDEYGISKKEWNQQGQPCAFPVQDVNKKVISADQRYLLRDQNGADQQVKKEITDWQWKT